MIKRFLADEIRSNFGKSKALVVYGARQTGKTTLVEELLKGSEYVYFSGDYLQHQTLFENLTWGLWDSLLDGRKTVFVDEAQKISNIGNAVKALIDRRKDVTVIMSGSSSFNLRSRTEESLTGRKTSYTLFPLSFGELCEEYGTVQEYGNMENRLVFGSYPAVVTTDDSKKNVIQELADSYLFKDLFSYNGIRKPDVLLKIVKALSYQIGSPANISEISNLVGASTTIVNSYIRLLVDSFIIFELPCFTRNRRNEIRNLKKYYFWDCGIRNAVIRNFSPVSERNDVGHLFENFVISERMKSNSYHRRDVFSYFWRNTDSKEVDYIEESGSGLDAYEIKWSPDKKAKLPLSLKNNYPDIRFEVLTRDNCFDFLK